METKGYVHVYTGNGKGKTTAAFGLALRALCAGKGVYVGQFVKSMKYNETKIERLFNGSDPAFGRIRIEQLGRGCFIGKDPESADAEAARKGWARCADLLRSGEYDVVILDDRSAFRTALDRCRAGCAAQPSSGCRGGYHGALCTAGTDRCGRPCY